MIVRSLLTCALLLALAAPTAAQEPPPTGIVWDYIEDDLLFFAVTHFEVCFETKQCLEVAVSGPFTDAQTAPGAVSFGVDLPPLRVGEHTASITVCNAFKCSEPVDVRFVLAIVPVPVTNGRGLTK